MRPVEAVELPCDAVTKRFEVFEGYAVVGLRFEEFLRMDGRHGAQHFRAQVVHGVTLAGVNAAGP